MQIVLDHEDTFGLFHPAQSFGAMNALCEMLLVVGASLLAMEYQATPAYLTHPREQARSHHRNTRALCGFSAAGVITNCLTPREDLAITPSLGCVQ
ncbi:hypothetical protein PMm318_A21400 [Pseudomonas moorei]